jgi:hypothetical protein
MRRSCVAGLLDSVGLMAPGQRVEMTRRTTLQPRYGIRLRVHPQDGAHAASPARVRGDVIGATPGPP